MKQIKKTIIHLTAYVGSTILLQFLSLPYVLSWSDQDLNINLNGTYQFDTGKALPGSNQSENLIDFAGKLMGMLLKLVASIGIVVVIYGGIKMMTSQGNSTGVDKGKKAITEAIVGIILVFISYLIISFIQDLMLTPS